MLPVENPAIPGKGRASVISLDGRDVLACRPGGFKMSRLGGCGTAADPDSVVGWLHDKAVLGAIEGEFLKAERELYGLCLPRVESDSPEPLETAYGLLDTGADEANITLNDLRAAALARIGDRSTRSDWVRFLVTRKHSHADGWRGHFSV